MEKSKYAVKFDESSANWAKNPELNRLFLTAQQNCANHLLNARGHIFLNEIYDALGMPRTSEGQVVGWLKANGSSVEFQILDDNFIDFNVDGVIYKEL